MFLRLAILVLLAFGVLFALPKQATSSQPLTLSQQQVEFEKILATTWQHWKTNHLWENGLVFNKHLKGGTSEGQSYGLLKAVYMDDPEVFDRIWRFTQREMQRGPGLDYAKKPYTNFDHLFFWHYGIRDNGQFGLLTNETATDGDEVIAYALLLAAEQWQKPAYRQAALPIIRDIWRKAIFKINGRYYLGCSGDIYPKFTPYMAMNASYVAPYIYREFAKADPKTPWTQLAQDVYPALKDCSKLTTFNIPPKWCGVRWQNATVLNMRPLTDRDAGFNPETPRIYWHLGMSVLLNNDSQARQFLSSRPFLIEAYKKLGFLSAHYSPSGQPLSPHFPERVSYAALVLQTALLEPQNTWSIYQKTLQPQWNPAGYWDYAPDYYPTSVVWFNLYAAKELLKQHSRTEKNTEL